MEPQSMKLRGKLFPSSIAPRLNMATYPAGLQRYIFSNSLHEHLPCFYQRNYKDRTKKLPFYNLQWNILIPNKDNYWTLKILGEKQIRFFLLMAKGKCALIMERCGTLITFTTRWNAGSLTQDARTEVLLMKHSTEYTDHSPSMLDKRFSMNLSIRL